MNNEEQTITREDLNTSVEEFLRNGGKIKQYDSRRKTLTQWERRAAEKNKILDLMTGLC